VISWLGTALRTTAVRRYFTSVGPMALSVLNEAIILTANLRLVG
jgi:hypothetical protein